MESHLMRLMKRAARITSQAIFYIEQSSSALVLRLLPATNAPAMRAEIQAQFFSNAVFLVY